MVHFYSAPVACFCAALDTFHRGDEEVDDKITAVCLFEYLLSEGLYELSVGGLLCCEL